MLGNMSKTGYRNIHRIFLNPVIKVVHDGFVAEIHGKIHLDYTTAK